MNLHPSSVVANISVQREPRSHVLSSPHAMASGVPPSAAPSHTHTPPLPHTSLASTTLQNTVTRDAQAVVKDTTAFLLNSSGVFALFLIIAGNYLTELFNVNLRSILATPLAKHIVAILTLYFFIVLLDESHIGKPWWNQALILALFYIMFLLLIKTEGRLTIVSLLLLGGLYFMNKWVQYRVDHNLPLSSNAHKALRLTEIVTGTLVLCSLAFGTLTYIGYHLTAHTLRRKSWSWWKFFIAYDTKQKMCDNIDWRDYGHYAWLGLRVVLGLTTTRA